MTGQVLEQTGTLPVSAFLWQVSRKRRKAVCILQPFRSGGEVCVSFREAGKEKYEVHRLICGNRRIPEGHGACRA
ncbi:MAG: hypothetical protein IJ733_20460 [Lachnospiraceae bacterium]|nr:hypothetical protein [Lachnospiraceae bacterium]